MANPFDPRFGDPALSQLWPPLLPEDRPPEPWEFARAMAQQSGDPAMAAMAGPDDPNWLPTSDDPMHVRLAYAVRDHGKDYGSNGADDSAQLPAPVSGASE